MVLALHVAFSACTLNMSISCSTACTVMVFIGKFPRIVSVKASAALINASAGVIVGIVKYLCLKKTALHVQICFVLVMYT